MNRFTKTVGVILALVMLVAMLPINTLAAMTYDRYNAANDPTVPVVSYGTKGLFFSDVHDCEYNLAPMLDLSDPLKEMATLAIGGDFESGMTNSLDAQVVTDTYAVADTYYDNDEMPVIVIKGNHEAKTSNEAFQAATGWPSIGNTAVVYADEAHEQSGDPLYYIFSLSWGGTSGSTGKFVQTDLDQFETFMTQINDKKTPVFVISHLPIHYYSDRRSAQNANSAIDLFNQYPNVVFCWGHNHTEADPMYTNILEPGDSIQWEANPATAKEILFSYCGLGSLRANGHLKELGFKADFTEGADATDIFLQYYYLYDQDTYDVEELTGATVGMDNDTALTVKADSEKTISIATVELQYPRALDIPADAVEYGDRFTVATNWEGSPTEFDYDTAYKAKLTITPVSGYTLDSNVKLILNGEEIHPIVSGNAITVEVEFSNTLEEETTNTYDLTEDVKDSAVYAIVGSDFDALANDAGIAGDVSMEADEITTVLGNDLQWEFIADSTGYLIKSTETDKFLGIGEGGDPSLAMVDATNVNWLYSPEKGIYTEYGGAEYLVVYNTYTDKFILSKDVFPYTNLVTLYSVAGQNSTIDLAAFNIQIPVAGDAVEDTQAVVSDRYEVSSLEWTPDDDPFGFGTEYTAVMTLKADAGYTFANNAEVRVNGVDTTLTAVVSTDSDGRSVAAVTVPFEATRSANAYNMPDLYMEFVEVNTLEEGGNYVITQGDENRAIINNPLNEYTQKATMEGVAVTAENGVITSEVLNSMVWNFDASGNLVNNGEKLTTAMGGAVSTGADDFAWSVLTVDPATAAIGVGYNDGRDDLFLTSVDGGFTMGAVNGPSAMSGAGANTHIYKLMYHIPVSAQLDGESYTGTDLTKVGLTKTYCDTDLPLDSELIFPVDGYYDIELDDAGRYYIYVTDYEGYLDEGDCTYGSIYIDVDKTPFVAADGVVIDYYTVSVNNGSNRIPDQTILKGFLASDPLVYRTGYDTVYYYGGTSHVFSFSDKITDTTVIDVSLVPWKVNKTVSSTSGRQIITVDRLGQYILIEGADAKTRVGFADVGVNDWFYTYVTDLASDGVVNGYPDGSFKPAGTVTWGEALKMVMLSAGYAPQTYAAGTHWASGYMTKAIADGIIAAPVDLDSAVDRAEVAEIAAAALKLTRVGGVSPFADTDSAAVLALYDKGIVEGSFDAAGQRLYKPDQFISRAEISAVIWRINNFSK